MQIWLQLHGCFFLGILLTLLLQFFLDSLQRLDIGCRPPWSKKKAIMDGELDEQDRKKYSSMMKSLKSKLMGKNSDRDKEEKTIGIPNITAVESKRSGETKFDSTAAESEIVDMTDENSDEVSIFTIIIKSRLHAYYSMLIIIIPAVYNTLVLKIYF